MSYSKASYMNMNANRFYDETFHQEPHVWFQKYAKTHLKQSRISKVFRGVPPLQGGGYSTFKGQVEGRVG